MSKSIILPIILFLLILPMVGKAQQRGKLVKNQSVLAMTAQMDTLPLWMVIITNKNTCRSVIEFKIDDGKVDTVSLDFDEDQQMMIHGDFILEFRNATKCENGSTEWIYIDNNISLRNTKSNPNPKNLHYENSLRLLPNSWYDCSFIPLR